MVFPKRCLRCKKEGRYLCVNCVNKVKFAEQVCIECGKASIDGITHVKCMKKQSLAGSVVVWEYKRVIRDAIVKMKYNFAYSIAEELSVYMTVFLKKKVTAIPKNAYLVPIPLHRRRENWRGFNQSGKVGELVASQIGWRFSPNILLRYKFTTPQVELKGKERRKNVKDVFVLNSIYHLQSTNYVLFDDVCTTGSTLKEAGKILMRNGAGSVWGLTIAR